MARYTSNMEDVLTKEAKKIRNREKSRRYSLAQYRAFAKLAMKHSEEYNVLFEAERVQIDGECGPLPTELSVVESASA